MRRCCPLVWRGELFKAVLGAVVSIGCFSCRCRWLCAGVGRLGLRLRLRLRRRAGPGRGRDPDPAGRRSPGRGRARRGSGRRTQIRRDPLVEGRPARPASGRPSMAAPPRPEARDQCPGLDPSLGQDDLPGLGGLRDRDADARQALPVSGPAPFDGRNAPRPADARPRDRKKRLGKRRPASLRPVRAPSRPGVAFGRVGNRVCD